MLQSPTERIILASASPSRRSLLAAAGLVFEVCPADIDETTIKRQARSEGASAAMAALSLADRKAQVVALPVPEALVVGADQILVCEGAWFDKPSDVAATRTQLRALRGRSHVLATAVVCRRGGSHLWHTIATPHLSMRNFSDKFLDCYLATEADTITGSVGGYRLEGRGIQLFDAVEGDYTAVLGLPLPALLSFLRSKKILMS
jgi:septum formation protein